MSLATDDLRSPENSPYFVRPLGILEKFFWLMDQTAPIHFSVAAEVEGLTTISDWRNALDAVQRRHPLLSVSIDTAQNGSPYFRRVPDAAIPLCVYADKAPSRWQSLLESELHTPIDTTQAPMIRATLIHQPRKSTLILTAQHSICDGMSLVFMIRDMLQFIAGGQLSSQEVPPSQDELMDRLAETLSEDAKPRGAEPMDVGAPVALRQRTSELPSVRLLRLSAEATNLLRERCRQEGTTVHAALAAAVAIAGRQNTRLWNAQAIRIMSPVNTRETLGAGEECAMYASTAYTVFPADSRAGFWDLARAARESLKGAHTPTGTLAAFEPLRQAFSPPMSPQEAREIELQALPFEVVLTNLGDVPINTRFGALTLVSLWGPMVLSGARDEQEIGAVTVNGSLHLNHASYSPIPFLLDSMEQALTEACDAELERVS
jgi:hypothetical protein